MEKENVLVCLTSRVELRFITKNIQDRELTLPACLKLVEFRLAVDGQAVRSQKSSAFFYLKFDASRFEQGRILQSASPGILTKPGRVIFQDVEVEKLIDEPFVRFRPL